MMLQMEEDLLQAFDSCCK